MILEALYRLAQHEELMDDPDHELKPVAWLVRVDDGGTLVAIEDTRSTPPQVGKKAPKPQARSFRVPRQPIRTSGDRAFFLCDKAEYALGVDPEPDPAKRRPPEKIAARFALFRAQVHDCLRETGDEGVRAVAALLDDLAAGGREIRLPDECEPNDLFAFVYAPDRDRLVHERPAVRAYWAALRRSAAAPDGGLRCLVTGEPVGEAALFPLLKKVPGGTPSGVSLVSFNAPAFESHGWKGNENAPISRGAAEAAATALNRLLHPAFPDPRPASLGRPLAKRHTRLSGDTVACYWAAERVADPFLDLFGHVLEPDPAVVGELYDAPWKGRLPSAGSRFYALVLTGTQGRAIVRGWIESTVDDVAKNLGRYFAELDVVRNTPPPKGREHPPFFPLRTLLASLAPPGRGGDVPAALAAQLFAAALQGSRYPLAVLQKALERARAEIGRSEWADLERRDARAALVKAVLVRNFNQELTPAMDPANTETGYLLGRLMAVLERLQQAALGPDVNATVIDRFFGAASAAPQSVFPRLLKNARNHARKAQDDTKTAPAARWLEGQIDEIAAALKVDRRAYGPGAGFPTHLSLEQQGLFVLGYHQQRHWLWMKKEDRERAEAGRAAAAAVSA